MPDFVRPTDVVPYVARPKVFNVPMIRGDGSNSYGGIPPAVTNQLPEYNNDSIAGCLVSSGGAGYKSAAQGATEAKFRTHINGGHFSRDDPIRFFGQPDATHWHLFFGSRTANAFSTYKSLREHPQSNAAGASVNGTAYWIPVFLVPYGGKFYGKMLDFVTVYYKSSLADAQANRLVRLPRGKRYITGCNMDDPDDVAVKAMVATKNASMGGGTRFAYGGNGFLGYTMLDAGGNAVAIPNNQSGGGGYSKWLKNPDGSDPWGGLAVAGGRLMMKFNSPRWSDGHNLWSPGGYDHMSHGIIDTDNGHANIGPTGWWEEPMLDLAVMFTHGGFADYGSWILSSDAHATMMSGRQYNLGESAHADWFGAWHDPTMIQWMRNGMGIDGFEPHELDDSVISSTQKMIVGQAGPDGRVPQLNLSNQFTSIPSNMMLLPDGPARGPANIRQRGA